MARLNPQSLGRPREPNFIPLALPLPLSGCGTRAVRSYLCRRHALMDGLHTEVNTRIHQGSSRAPRPPPPGISRRLLSLAQRHTLTHACHSGQGEMVTVHFPRAPFAPGEIVLNEASALMGETKNLQHGFSLSENGPAVLSTKNSSVESNHDPFPSFPRLTPWTRGLRLE